MATPDLDVVKEIPGYKVILKAVLKSQIQQLVEQLSSHTDEESVILTASVSDGTLSHLGSDSGKFFLNDHEDIKSQFLGFCLKRSHEKKLREKNEHMSLSMSKVDRAQRSFLGQQFSPSKNVQRTARNRPQPYKRIERKPASFNSTMVTSTPKPSDAPIQAVIKVERNSTSEEEDDASSKQGASISDIAETPNKSNTGSTEIAADSMSNRQEHAGILEGLKLESDLSGLTGVVSTLQSNNETEANSGIAQNVAPIVKLEAVSDSEKELEIIGVEPGQPVLGVEPGQLLDSMWGPEPSTQHSWSGGTDNQADMQEYNESDGRFKRSKRSALEIDTSKFQQCPICKKALSVKSDLRRHLMVHSGERPFECETCGRRFQRKHHLRDHKVLVHRYSKI